MSYTYPYPRPALTVDAVVFRNNDNRTEVLLIRRKNPPFQDGWALPGGFVDMDEMLEDAIARELKEETGLENIGLKQMHAFSTPGRDPRGHTISVVFLGALKDGPSARAGDDASQVKWFDVKNLPQLAFDHREIVEMAVGRFDW